MLGLAQTSVVVVTPKQFLIATVRNDVIDGEGHDDASLSSALAFT
jgi:hypothetical protein